MKKYIIVTLTALLLSSCGYKGSLLIKENEVIAHSNRPMEITKVVNKEGVVSYTYSSKKDSGWMENLLTLIGLKAVNK